MVLVGVWKVVVEDEEGGGGSCRLPTAPCSTLQAHTLTSKRYPYMPEA